MNFNESVSLLASSFKTWYRQTYNKEFVLLHHGHKCPLSVLIAQGRYSRVYRLTGYAYKHIQINSKNYYEDCQNSLRELIFYNCLNHPNIMKTIKSQIVMQHGTFKRIIHQMNYIDKCLDKYICSDLNDVKRIMSSIIKGLNYLHTNHIVHGDIKPANILLSDTNVWITDFTLSTFEGRGQQMAFGTLFWRSPECALEVDYKSYSDIWSLGIIMLDLIYRSSFMETQLHVLDNKDLLHKLGRILDEPSDDYQYKNLFARDETKIPLINRELTIHMTDEEMEQVTDFILKCLKWNPLERPTTEELLKHSLFKPIVLKVSVPNINNVPVIIWKNIDDKEYIKSLLPKTFEKELLYITRLLLDQVPVYEAVSLAIKFSSFIWCGEYKTSLEFESEIYMIFYLLRQHLPLEYTEFFDNT